MHAEGWISIWKFEISVVSARHSLIDIEYILVVMSVPLRYSETLLLTGDLRRFQLLKYLYLRSISRIWLKINQSNSEVNLKVLGSCA